jgi:hypothetical protein
MNERPRLSQKIFCAPIRSSRARKNTGQKRLGEKDRPDKYFRRQEIQEISAVPLGDAEKLFPIAPPFPQATARGKSVFRTTLGFAVH